MPRDDLASTEKPSSGLRVGAFTSLAFIWLALDLPLYATRAFLGAGNIWLFFYILALPWITIASAGALLFATYASIRMLSSEREHRHGVVAAVLCIITIAFTLHIGRWWVSREMRDHESPPTEGAASLRGQGPATKTPFIDGRSTPGRR